MTTNGIAIESELLSAVRLVALVMAYLTPGTPDDARQLMQFLYSFWLSPALTVTLGSLADAHPELLKSIQVSLFKFELLCASLFLGIYFNSILPFNFDLINSH